MKKTTLLIFLVSIMSFVGIKAQSVHDGAKRLVTDVSQLSSSFSDYQEGKDIGALIDNNTSTFWHSDWHNQATGDLHWVDVALKEPVKGLVCLYMHRRNASNDHPTKIVVSGSSDGSIWKEITTVEFPYQGFVGHTSEPFVVKEAVSHFRLTVTDCYGSSGFRKFWHAAEIQLYHVSDQFEFDTDLTGLVINEIQVANIDQFMDHSHNYGGWIELYNTSQNLLSLNSAVIRHTDYEGVVEEYSLGYSHGMLQGGGLYCLWFDHNANDGIYGGNAHLQIPFKMDADGGTIALIDADGNTVDSMDYPPAIARCSYARKTDGGDEWGWTGEATPLKSNNGSTFTEERLEAPVIDQESTLFTTSLIFRVDIPSGATLRYTTDGSTPTAKHGTISSFGRFSVKESKVYRFVLVADDKLPSPVVTRTFIKDEHGLELPILSISTHPDNLFNDSIGVYTKGTNGVSGNGQSDACNWNMDWDRPVNVEYLVKGEDGYTMALNQEAEFKIAGGFSRAYGGGNGWEMKSSFRLKTNKVYEGKNVFDYPIFFRSKIYNKYKTLQVRNGGNDTYCRIKDAATQEIIRSSGFYVDCQAWQPAHVYFNGQYLGMLNIRENNNKNYGESGYGIDGDDIDHFEINWAVGYEQKSGDRESFMQWLALSKELAAKPTENTWQKICQLVDVDEFCNYMAAECYIGPGDWLTNCNNLKGFKGRNDGGKFHMVMFDTDSGFGSNNMIASIYNLLSNNDGRYSDNGGKSYLADIFFNMLAYEPFKEQFINAFCIVGGSVMNPERCRKIIDEMKSYVSSALAIEGNSPNSSADALYNKIASTSERDARINNVKSFFGLTEMYNVKLECNIPEARLLLGGQEIPTRKFDGAVFAPAVLTAKAPAGYTFQGWKLSLNNRSEKTIIPFKSSWQYYDKGSLDDTQWNQGSYGAGSWLSGTAPFGYGTVGTTDKAADYNTTLDYGGDASNKRPTYYFRKRFILTEEPTVENSYILNYYLDDGAIFYINGVEVGKFYCNSGISYNDYSTDYMGSTAAYGSIEVPREVLKKGTNLISVEVHNTSATSTDIFFDAELKSTKLGTSIVSTQETIELGNVLGSGQNHLIAVYEKIPDKKQLLEVGASPIRINEVSAGNSIHINDYFKRNDWVELYNTTDTDIDVAGMYLSDSKSSPQKYQISASESSASTIVPAHGHLIVWCDKLTPINQLHAPFKLDNADGAIVSIQSADGTWNDRMEYYEQDRWSTYGRYPDGGHMTSHLSQPTIALPNVLGTYDFAGGDGSEWIDDDMAITIELVKGWNWMSHNLSENIHKSRFVGYAHSILGQQESSTKDSITDWMGTLNYVKAAHGYKIAMNTGSDVTLRGQLYDTATPIVVKQGWNWIGFPLYNTTTLEAALSNYTATEGDAIVGLDAFATYEKGEWVGTLTSLTPGRAYLLKSGASQEFCWNSLSEPTQRARRYRAPQAEAELGTPWSVDVHAYPNVHSVIAAFEIDGEQATTHNYTLAAFCGEECRDVAQLVDGYLYMNIHGEGGEVITFRLVDQEGQIHFAEQTLTMSPETVTGSRQAPYLLTVKGSAIHPLTSVGSKPVAHYYYTTSGQSISCPTTGIYIQKTIYDNGYVSTRKIVR